MKTPAPAIYQFLGLSSQGDIGPYTTYTAHGGGLVIFLKSKIDKPASLRQVHQRNRFRLVALQWQALDDSARDTWARIAQEARLRITGYDLFTYLQLTGDRGTVATVERHTAISLDVPETRPL